MRLLLPCFDCGYEAFASFVTVQYNDSGRHDVTCPRGHRFIAVLQAQKFEVLFDLGGFAIIDGYYREAVSSFTASMERFQEFAVRCLLLHAGIAPSVIEDAWKHMANRSEMQLGAFIALWTNQYGEPPVILKSDDAKFRNAVIHKGKIPTRQEAVDYGDLLLGIIRPQMRILKKDFAAEIQALVFQTLRGTHDPGDAGVRRATHSGGSILVLAKAEDPDTPLESHLAAMRVMEQKVDEALLGTPRLLVDSQGNPAPMFQRPPSSP